MKAKNITTFDEFKDKHYGKTGTAKRNKFEEGYENFKVGAMIFGAWLEKGMTQEQFANKVGMTKSYISKIVNNIKEVRLLTLQKIIELGFDGHLEFSIKHRGKVNEEK